MDRKPQIQQFEENKTYQLSNANISQNNSIDQQQQIQQSNSRMNHESQLNNNLGEQNKNTNNQQKRRLFSIKIINEEEAKNIKSADLQERQRIKNLQLLIKIKPQVFDAEDQAINEDHIKNIKWTSLFVVIGFISTSAFRVWQIKRQDQNIMAGLSVIFASYLPAMAWYNYHNRNYQRFLGDVSQRYKNRIGDDQLNKFRDNGGESLNSNNENLERLRKLREQKGK